MDGLARRVGNLEIPQEQQGGDVGGEPAEQPVRPVRDHPVRGDGQAPHPRFEEIGIEPGPLDAHRAVVEGEGEDGVRVGGCQPFSDLRRSLFQQGGHLFLADLDGAPFLAQDIAREKDRGGEGSARQVGLDGQVGLTFLLHSGPGHQGAAGEYLLAEFQVLFRFLAQPSRGPERFILGLFLLEFGQFPFLLVLRDGFRQLEIEDLFLQDEIPVPELGILPVPFRWNRTALFVFDEQEFLRLPERFLFGLGHRVVRDFRRGQDFLVDIPQQALRVRRREQALDGQVHDPGEVGLLVEGGHRGGGILPEKEVQALRRKGELEVQRKTEELASFGIVDLLDFGIDRKQRVRVHQTHSLMLGRGSGDLPRTWHR